MNIKYILTITHQTDTYCVYSIYDINKLFNVSGLKYRGQNKNEVLEELERLTKNECNN